MSYPPPPQRFRPPIPLAIETPNFRPFSAAGNASPSLDGRNINVLLRNPRNTESLAIVEAVTLWNSITRGYGILFSSISADLLTPISIMPRSSKGGTTRLTASRANNTPGDSGPPWLRETRHEGQTEKRIPIEVYIEPGFSLMLDLGLYGQALATDSWTFAIDWMEGPLRQVSP